MKFLRSKKTAWSDEELLARFQSTGESHWFGELYDRYIALIYGLCLKYLKDADRAEEATMQLFEQLLEKVPRQEIKTFRTWIHTVARNHCLQLLRKKEREFAVDFSIHVVESDDSVHLFDEQNDERHFTYLADCLAQLPEPQRRAIEQFFLQEQSYADIVARTGYQLKSVKSYIQNGKRNLKICIEKKMSA